MQLLDRWVVQKPQLSPLEFTLLSLTVLAAGCGPFILNGEVTGVLAPSAAACKYQEGFYEMLKDPKLP